MNMNVVNEVNKINTKIRARIPIIAITTHEEARLFRFIEGVIEKVNETKRKKNPKVRKTIIKVWSIVSGLRTLDKLNTIHENTADPLEMLRTIHQADEDAVYILCDFHPYLENPEAIRYLRELYRIFQDKRKNLILMSPDLSIPAELEKLVSVIDLPLPNEEELEDIYDKLFAHWKTELKINNKNKEKIINALKGLTEIEAKNTLFTSIVEYKDFNVQHIINEKANIIKGSKSLEFFHPNVTLSNIGGLELLKGFILETKESYTKEAKENGIEAVSGILLFGMSGTGKSLVCKAIGSIMQLPLVRFNVSALFGGIVGETESNFRSAKQRIASIKPCVIWIDEIEKALGSDRGVSDGGVSNRLKGEFLTWLQDETDDVLVVATANDIRNLENNPELMRKGRFSEIFFLQLPTPTERFQIFNIHFKKRNLSPKTYDVAELVNLTVGFSGAEIEEIIKAGNRKAWLDGKRPAKTSDYVAVIKETKPLSTTMKEQIDALTRWFESGRARASSISKDTNGSSSKLDMDIDLEE